MAVPPPLPASSADKTGLRRTLRAARTAFVAGLDAHALAEALAALDRHLQPLLEREGVIAGYVAHRSEADVAPFLRRAFEAGRDIALPHIADGDETMRFTGWRPDSVLAPGLLGIPQTVAGEPLTPAILLTPLVGFDRAGHRLGQGGGYYDRWFARHPDALRIGIAWSVQEAADIPADPWDIPLHAIVTEKEWITP